MSARQAALLAAVAFAIASPILQALGNIGLSPSDFSRSGDQTLRAAGYAFSIWGLIYVGLAAFAGYQALPSKRTDALLDIVRGPALVAIMGTGLWIWASAFDARWASVGIILVSAASLTVGLLRAAREAPEPDLKARALVFGPLALLAGWLTIASAINVLTVLTAEGLIGAIPRAAALAGIATVVTVALLVLRAHRLALYGAPIAWGLVAVWVAERGSKGDVAVLALVSAILVAAGVAWQSLRRRG